MKLSTLLNGTATCTVLINDEPLKVKYRTCMLTDENKARARETDNDDDYLNIALEKTIIEWGMTDDNDNPLPCTKETLAPIDERVKSGIWIALLEDSSPNVKTGSI